MPHKSLEAHKNYQSNWYHRTKGTSRTKYIRLKNQAKDKNKDFHLTEREYEEITSHPCFYCGGSLPSAGGGVDRINSDIGYVLGNCRPCCYACNKAKSDMTETEFKEWLFRVFNNYLSLKVT